MSLSEAFLVPFHTLIKLRYTKALDWSSLISGPKAKSSSEVTNLTLFTVSDHYSNHNIMACFKGPCCSAGLWVTAPLLSSGQFSRSVLSDSLVTPWTAACQASLSITNPQSLLKPMSIESVMPSNHLILCCPLLLLPSIFPSIRVFSEESALPIRWPKHWSFSFSISPSSEQGVLLVQLTRR